MKKIFTLVAALFLTVALFATDRRPVIKLNNNNNYKVVIDGRTYFGDDINIRTDYFYRGQHTVKVYEMRRGFFGRTERLVNSTTFYMDNDDVLIRIDRHGGIMVKEERKGKWKNGKDYDNDRHHDMPMRRF